MIKVASILKNNRWIVILSSVFAVCSFMGNVGRILSENGDFSVKILSKGFFFSLIAFFISIAVLFGVTTLNERCTHESKHGFVWHFVIMFITQVIVSLPMIIAFFPGMVESDAYVQLMAYFGDKHWDSHFPPISTEIFGGGV